MPFFLEKKVTEKTRDLRAVLDHVRQGLVTVNHKNLMFDEEKSKGFDSIIGDDTKGVEDLLDSLSLLPDEKKQILEVLRATVRGSHLTFICNDHLLPLEATRRVGDSDQYLELDWVPMLCEDGETIEKILLGIRDVSEAVKRREEKERQDREAELITQLINASHSSFAKFYQRSNEIIKGMAIDFDKKGALGQETVRNIFIGAHTLKGTSRTLGLKYFAEQCHQLEDALSLNEEQENKDDCQRAFQTLQQELNSYSALCRDKLGWEVDSSVLTLPREEVLRGVQYIASRFNHEGEIPMSQIY